MSRPVLDALPRPVAWVFTSGGARAAAQVGMAEVLLEQGYFPELIVGSSFGAINAGALAAQPPDMERLRQTWRDIGTESVFATPGAAAVRAFAPRTGRSAREWRAILAGALGDQADQPVPETLVLTGSDLESGDPVRLTSGTVLDAVAASSTIPVLLAPVDYDGRLVLDGGLTAAAPLEQALDAGAASIVLLDTAASAVPEPTLPGLRWWQVAALSYNHQLRSQLKHSLGRVAARIPVAVISSDGGTILDFTDPAEQFRSGRTAAAVALARELPPADLRSAGVHGRFAEEPPA